MYDRQLPYSPPLGLGDRFWRQAAVHVLLARINRSSPPLCRFPVLLKRSASLVLRFIDHVARVKVCQWIIPCRSHDDDLPPGLVWVVYFLGREIVLNAAV